ncbi:DegT/DnrJ/EryC1/StrS family aminotransferase [Magnetospirillum aberrantis]|uniref:Aminotransferase class I/II-fold pyridoxal phosphate-dependent enzyme n=1 Tax=Magnetospirillum aberrantis SpK TaxID=908842 RepID=A0A7C9QVC7_9PROT|nr:aminotransferase class I/II-fold pyridoxal phosphate-dependent enzyme [Magnetospirillum aberrantis]NFV81583.1 aminotransferase class I/II-fold pyridoxal phosphate-dependent enzyme [Magnetospirillum aberrantis SpK]
MTAIPRLSIPLPFPALLRTAAALAGAQGGGAEIAAFERAFAARYGRQDAVCFCRARMGFFHLLRCLDLAEGAEVLIGGLHVADFVNIIRLAGFVPVVVDLEPRGFRLDEDDLERKLSPRSAVLLVTHLSGYVHDMPRLRKICDDRGVMLVEDCSQAFAARYDGQRVGTFGHAAIFSLSLLKSVCTLNGGIVLAEDPALLERLHRAAEAEGAASRGPMLAETLKNLVIKTATWPPLFSLTVLPLLRLTAAAGDWFARYQKTNKTVVLRDRLPPVFRERFTAVQARLGMSLLPDLDARESKRQAAGRLLRSLIEPDGKVALPPQCDSADNGYWLFPLVVEDPARLKAALSRQGVDSAPMLLAALSTEAAFAGMGFSAPNAEWTRAHTLFVPMYPTLDETDIRRIAAAIADFQRAS